MKKQIVVIHGGDTFESHEEYMKFLKEWVINFRDYLNPVSDWKKKLASQLGNGFEVILPNMPNKTNARFDEWKIWFEKFIPFLEDGVILIGHSLGGAFLSKYLTENKFPKNIGAVFLVSACFGDHLPFYKAADFHVPDKLDSQTDKIFLYHSKDDPVVPFSDLEMFKQAFPNATVRVFEDRGHFNQEQFPELVEDIRSL
jgi:predicted alpha/beta hydrolase family esterase